MSRRNEKNCFLDNFNCRLYDSYIVIFSVYNDGVEVVDEKENINFNKKKEY